MAGPQQNRFRRTQQERQISIIVPRIAKWTAGLLLALPLAAVLFIAIFGWNWARGPLERIVTERTGRQLVIGGDLGVHLGWPSPRITAHAVTFANPAWAKQKQMIAVDDVEFTLNLAELLRHRLVFPEVRLTRPVVFLEQAADGRKTWLLDLDQSDETARIPIGRLTLDRGQLGYDDIKKQTSVLAHISTEDVPRKDGTARRDAPGEGGVVFNAKGQYKGLALGVKGAGGSVLKLHDTSVPYPLRMEGTVGSTAIKADGTITSLLKFVALDMQLALRGQSLAQLYAVFAIPFPETNPYTTAGRLVHSGTTWRYDKFTGVVGKSDLAGSLQVDTAGARPFVRADLASKVLEFEDLGPLVGAKAPAEPAPRKVSNVPAPAAVAGPHVLPDIPFKTDRWSVVDADVTLRAGTIRRAKALPIENLSTHLKLQDSQVSLDPLDFGFAGGHLKSVISLDGRKDPIQARAKIAARKLQLAKLFPTVDLSKASIGEVNGEFDLAGSGNSVGRMLATSNGRAGLLVANGEISELLMQQMGLHLVEMLQLKLTGDRRVKLRCGVADFGVKAGVMQANALILDTDVTTVLGSGSVDLGRETLDLTLAPKTRRFSPVALRGPIYVRGTFSNPKVDLDVPRIAARGAGALLLGLVNPLLVLLPLIEPGPGVDPECARLVQDVRKIVPHAPAAAAPVAAR
jgi:uncharacterized protein involved in outer membrane biogenesis